MARWIWPTIGVALVALPSLPLPAWSGSPDPGPIWGAKIQSWAVGVAVVLIGGLVANRLGMGLRRTGAAWRWAWVGSRRASARFLRPDTALAFAALVVLAWGWAGVRPIRWADYRNSVATMKLHPERELAARGVSRALVLVPESWGSRIVVRWWGLGAPPAPVERAYRRLDTCDLDGFVRAAESAGWDGAATAARLRATMGTVVEAPPWLTTWPDPTVRFRQEYTPPERCQVEMRRDLGGFTLYGSLAWRNEVGLDSGIVFARDLTESNGPLLARYQGWDLWRYAPPPDHPNAPPVLTRPGAAADLP